MSDAEPSIGPTAEPTAEPVTDDPVPTPEQPERSPRRGMCAAILSLEAIALGLTFYLITLALERAVSWRSS